MENPTYNTLLNVVMNLKGIKETVFCEKDYLESILKIENEIDNLNEKCDCLRNEYLRLKAVNEIIRFANKYINYESNTRL